MAIPNVRGEHRIMEKNALYTITLQKPKNLLYLIYCMYSSAFRTP